MSNTSFNFLSDSYLTRDNKEEFLKKTLNEIEQELDEYRKFLKDNKEELDKECIKDNDDSVAISDFGSAKKIPKIEDITQKSLFLNKFVIDDPIQPVSFKNLDIINNDRRARGFEVITETKAKENLWDKLQYMKCLLPGVNTNVGYIKFYPLSKEPTNELLNIINVPDLSFPEKFPEIYEWFLKKIIVKTVDDNHKFVDLVEPCKKLGISFQNDGNSVFLPAFMNFQFQNILPQPALFTKWKEDEIIKSIRDRYVELLRKNEFKLKFGAIVSTESEFEFDFLSQTIISPLKTTSETKILRVLTKMKMPSLASTSFEKVMEVRQFFDDVFEGFRKQLKDDIICLQQTSDEKQLEVFSKELEAKYEAMIKEVETKMKFKFNFTGFDYFPIGLDIATLLTTNEQNLMLLTGVNILYKIYEGLVKQRNQVKNNQCYFLYKIKNN